LALIEGKQRCESLQSLFDIPFISGIIIVFVLYYQDITKVMFFKTPYSRLSTFHHLEPPLLPSSALNLG
jgi:hypothetical protein